MNIKDVKKLNIPKTSGCYKFLDSEDKIIYIGKAVDLRSRVFSYFRKSANHTGAKKRMLLEIAKIEWIKAETEIEALLLEANLIKKHQPVYNIDLRDDKRFSYIKVSTGDEIPGIFVTRKIDKSGKYFGPFTSAMAVRETLKTIRKIWPYCTERKIKNKACFYSQIGRCTGVCGGEFDLKEYKTKIIKPIILFLSGEKRQIIKNYELRITKLEKLLNNTPRVTKGNACGALPAGRKKTIEKREEVEEELSRLKRQLLNINYVLVCASIISISEKYAADVVELAKVLRLPKIPERIEGYDISNIFGKVAVGSMVVFQGGEPNKNEYRKFKIKIVDELGDVGMLKEVLERRLKHIAGVDVWPEPDLIIIDGGKAQLNIALRILKKHKLEIPVIAISKGKGLRSSQAPDKIFFPGEKKALELPLASPALHIIKRVRDEAHRFAIKYHRELRKKKLFL